MTRYIIKRLLLMIPVLLSVAIIIFTIMYFVPGSPAAQLLGGDASEAAIKAKEEQMGLNEPYIVQLGNFLYNLVFRLDLGNSYTTNESVIHEILARFPRTLTFACCCMCITVIIGIPLGVTAAVHQNGIVDKGLIVLAMCGVSLPQFWVALMLVILFSVKLHLLPAYGVGGLEHYILPTMASAISGTSMIARQTRSSMLEVIRSDFVTTARAKGLSERTILYSYALPNGLIPVIQTIGGQFGMTLGGAVVLENVFNIPGLGTYMTNAISSRNYPAVRGSVLFIAFAFGIVMLLVDLAFAFVDPRIKAQYTTGKNSTRRVKKHEKCI